MSSLTASELEGMLRRRLAASDAGAGARAAEPGSSAAKIAREGSRCESMRWAKLDGRMLVNYAVVKAFNGASLDAFRQAGFNKVGTIPEKLRVARGPHGAHLVRDEARITPQRRHGRTGQFIPFSKTPTIREREAIETGLGRIRRLGRLDILTTGLSTVCPICEDISNSGPYSIDEAEGLISAYPDCLCSYGASSTVPVLRFERQ